MTKAISDVRNTAQIVQACYFVSQTSTNLNATDAAKGGEQSALRIDKVVPKVSPKAPPKVALRARVRATQPLLLSADTRARLFPLSEINDLASRSFASGISL